MSGGGVALGTGVPTTDQLRPPSDDSSTKIDVQQNPFEGLKLVSVVKMLPSGVMCGSTYVAPCGVCGARGSASGFDQSVCVPSGFAFATETNGSGVRLWKTTHIR